MCSHPQVSSSSDRSVCLMSWTGTAGVLSSHLTTMRRSPRRPLILRRRKLPFQQHDPPGVQNHPAADSRRPPGSPPGWCFPDGIRVLDHPFMSDTKVVVIPKTADVQGVIQALSAKGKESGAKGPSKFILLSGNAGHGSGPAAGEGGGSTKNSACQSAGIMHQLSNKPVPTLKPRRFFPVKFRVLSLPFPAPTPFFASP